MSYDAWKTRSPDDNNEDDMAIEQEFLDEGEAHPTLGPHYFAARKTAEEFMSVFQAEHFAPLLKKFTEEFGLKVQEDLEDWLLSNVESNLHTRMWHQIDESVRALLHGKKWALERYALGSRYDCDEIRAAVAKHIPKELQDARIADLEHEVKRLRDDLQFYQRR